MNRVVRLLVRLIFVFAIPIMVAYFTYLYLRSYFIEPVNPSNNQVVLVEIAPGMSFKQIATELALKNLVKAPWSIEILARIKQDDKKISAGEYELSQSMTPIRILEKLASGEVFQRKFTLKEGETISVIGELVEKAGLVSAQELNKELEDPVLLTAAGIQADSFEGYLFPDTYAFSRPITARKIIWKMLNVGEKNWPAEYSNRAYQLGFTRHEIITLASIIEKESGNTQEQPQISSVFHNRLNQDMRLQADPTVIYGIKNFDGNLTKAHLLTPTPYNTYTNKGLPPGPICNPGALAIKAALYPAETNYLFFVADGSGGHVFSNTLSEHNNNVRKYQLNRKRNSDVKQETESLEEIEADVAAEPGTKEETQP
ncbi:MAG: endolytic transglycosylase MltG [Bdellovibrionota bacterium]